MGEVVKYMMRSGKKITSMKDFLSERDGTTECGFLWNYTTTHQVTEREKRHMGKMELKSHKIDSRVHPLVVYGLRFKLSSSSSSSYFLVTWTAEMRHL